MSFDPKLSLNPALIEQPDTDLCEDNYSPLSAVSPTSPSPPTTKTSDSGILSSTQTQHNFISVAHQLISKQNTKVVAILSKAGFNEADKLSDTLQGSVWRAYKTMSSDDNNSEKMKSSVIKVTNRLLHKNSSAVVNGSLYKVTENILKEQCILKYITQRKNCPNSIAKFERFFRTRHSYYLQMEDGGVSLFNFVQKAHRSIRAGEIEISEWHKVVRTLLKQMIGCIEYLHSINIVHFDISLENWLINDVQVEVDEYEDGAVKLRFVTEDIQIKLCDFGLAELFTKSECLSNKWCGKRNYKGPEVAMKKKHFDAKANDIWCFGVCLFVISVGSFPFDIANKSCEIFEYVFDNSIVELLRHWNMIHYVDPTIVWLFHSIFQFEDERISLQKIKKYAQDFVY